TTVLVGSRTCRDLNLTVTTAHFSVDGSDDHADLPDHVGVDHCGRKHTVLKTTVTHAQAITNGVDRTRSNAGQTVCVDTGNSGTGAETGQNADEIEHISAHERQVLHFSLRQ